MKKQQDQFNTILDKLSMINQTPNNTQNSADTSNPGKTEIDQTKGKRNCRRKGPDISSSDETTDPEGATKGFCQKNKVCFE